MGGPDFIEALKRAVVATVLLVAFKEITDGILTLTQGLAGKIDDMSGLDEMIRMAGEKTRTYSYSPMSLVIQFNDLLLAALSFLSFLVLYVARYLMVAIYHFTWLFLTMMAPILLLFHLISPRITLNLFRSLAEVASWHVVWAALSAMLKALPFGNAYMAEGNYVTVIVLNIVIALAVLLTPLIVRSLIGSGLAAMAGTLGPATVATIMALPTRGTAVLQMGRQVLGDTRGYAQHIGDNYYKRLTSKPSQQPPHSLKPFQRPAPPSVPPPPRIS